MVKFIGDEAMFTVEDSSTACELALALVEGFTLEPSLPPVRVGLAVGPAVPLHGDYYGGVVNLAARLAKAGEPSQVIVCDSLCEAAGERFVSEPVPQTTRKGYDAPVAAFRLLRNAS